MALETCKECESQVSDRAKSCPRCGAPVPRRNVFLIFFLILGAMALLTSTGGKNETKKTKQKPSVFENLKTDEASQNLRLGLMQDSINNGIFYKIQSGSGYPHVYVGSSFYNLSFDDKKTILGVVLAYYYSQNPKNRMVFLDDEKTGKRKGKFSQYGLDLN